MTLARLPVVHFTDPPNAWPAGRRVVLLVPGEDAIALELELPDHVGRRAANRIAVHALEDLIGEDMESMHLVQIPRARRSAANRGQAVATSWACMKNWFEVAERAHVRLAGILPDYLALPWEPGEWTVEIASGRVRTRFDRVGGFAAELGLGTAILERRLKETATPPERIRLLGEPHSVEARELLTLLRDTGIQMDTDVWPPGPLQLKRGEFDANLVVGAFRERLNLGQGIIRWRTPAGLALAALLAWTFNLGLALYAETNEIRRLDRQINQIFRTEFVPDGPIVDIRRQVMRSLEALRAEAAVTRNAGGFLALVAACGRTLVEGRGKVSRLTFRDGALTVYVTLENFRALQTMTTRLVKRGLEVDMESSTSSGEGGVSATLALRLVDARVR